MDEYIDILDKNGNKTGKTCLKTKAHKKGLLHASVHIWIINNKGEVLIQKRAKDKDTFPNLWDVSVAGHISAGEKPETSVLREVEEEIGLLISVDQLDFIQTFRKKVQHNHNLIDNELHHVYMCNLNFDFDSLKVQEEEVSEIKLITLKKLADTLKIKDNGFVPHGKNYYILVIKNLNKYNS